MHWLQLAGLGLALQCLSTSTALLLKIDFVRGLLVEKGGPVFLRR